MDLLKARLSWVELYARTGDAGLVCRRCGISRPTLRKWWRRFQSEGEAGLIEKADDHIASPLRRCSRTRRQSSSRYVESAAWA